MFTSATTLTLSVIGVSLIHSILPHHWLPFVLVGRRQNWKQSRILIWLGTGALAHMLSTISIGLVMGYLGHAIDERWEHLHGLIPGLILIAFGAGYFLSHFHRHVEISDRMAGSTLVVMLGLSPCVAVAPFFLIVGPLGLRTLILMAVLMAFASIGAMIFMGWLAANGMSKIKLDWLEQNESRVLGSLLVLLGVSFIFIH